MERTLYYNVTDKGIDGGWQDKWCADFMVENDKKQTYTGQIKVTVSKEGFKIEEIKTTDNASR